MLKLACAGVVYVYSGVLASACSVFCTFLYLNPAGLTGIRAEPASLLPESPSLMPLPPRDCLYTFLDVVRGAGPHAFIWTTKSVCYHQIFICRSPSRMQSRSRLLVNDRWQFGLYGKQNVGNWLGELPSRSRSLPWYSRSKHVERWEDFPLCGPFGFMMEKDSTAW